MADHSSHHVSQLSVSAINLENEYQMLTKLIYRNFNQHRCTKVFSNFHKAAKVVKMMPAKDLTNLSSEAEKYLRLLQNPKVNTTDLSASLQCAQRLCKAVATGAEAAQWFIRTARLLRPLLLQLLFVPLYTVFLGVIARSLQTISIIIIHFDSQLQALRSQIQHISSLNLRHGPLVDSVADSLVHENSTRNIISDLRVVYSQSKPQIHLQPSILKTRVKNDGMTEMLLSHSVATIATPNISAVDPLVITDIRNCSGGTDGINCPDISLVSTEFNSSASSESKILPSNMSQMASLSSFSSTLKACNDIPNGMNSLIGVPSSSFSQISMGIGLCSANQTSSVKQFVDPVYQSYNHSPISAKNQDKLIKGNAVADDVVMITALPPTSSINGRIGIEEDFGEIVSASIEVGPDTSNIFKNPTKGSNAAFEHSLPTSLDRKESVKRLTMLDRDEDLLSFDDIETGRCPAISDVTSVSFTMESGDVKALNKSGISTSSEKKPHTSQMSSMEQDIASVTKSKRSKSKFQGKAESDSSEEKKESSNNFHELPITNKRKKLRKSKNSVEKNCIDDIFRNYL